MFTAVSIQDANGIDVPLLNSNRLTGQCSGLHGLPQPRKITRARPGQHGEINNTRYYGSRQPVWNGTIHRAAVGTLWDEHDAIMAALWGAVEEPRLLKWTRTDGISLQSWVKLADAMDPVLRAEDSGTVLRYQLTFDREDPRNFSQVETEVTGAALEELGGGMTMPASMPVTFTTSSGGQATIVDAGPIGTSPVYEIHGAVVAPTIRIVDTMQDIVIADEIGSGDYLEIDVRARAALLGGTTHREDLVDFSLTTWADLPPGQSTVQLLAASFDPGAHVKVRYRPAYP